MSPADCPTGGPADCPTGGPTPCPEPLLAEAAELASTAGAMTLKWFRRPNLAVDYKPDGSEVSEADRAVEQFLRDELGRRFAADAVMGEEAGGTISPTGRTWVVDPIDGTRGFVRGVPLFATLVALVDEQGPLLGVIDLPALGHTLAAGRGIGCRLDDHRCTVSDTGTAGTTGTPGPGTVSDTGTAGPVPAPPRLPLAGALVNASDFAAFTPAQFGALRAAGAMLRTWGDAYGYFLVATGAADVMIDPVCETWDLAPMPVILAEAGGVFTDVAGNPSYTSRNGVASNGPLHPAVLEAMNAGS